ncbi:hypothetical protein Poli38472_002648 [Pythium oligandrum]|uniref:PX domain-containing protein n=1 Tax=Pythium oligandrum TaxID=41045 RepID=A0A8K1FLC6_PYTOL|nr:hypothetical protein Poli38472_002648 [Pythium oligandrum]|eukprot:TMW63707.1 hypothetical protein Poli38472_002648 [Pythium oligandrum]
MSFSPVSSPSEVAQFLRLMETATLLPSPSTAPAQAQLTTMQVIETVAIRESVKRNGHRYYLIDVYFKASSRSPTSVQGIPKKPSLQIQRRFSDFMSLRYEIYHYARQRHSHGNVPCHYCAKIIAHNILGRGQPGLFTKIVNSEDSTRRLLDQFTKKIVDLTLRTSTAREPECAGQKYIPLVVSRFLHPDEPSNEEGTKN